MMLRLRHLLAVFLDCKSEVNRLHLCPILAAAHLPYLLGQGRNFRRVIYGEKRSRNESGQSEKQEQFLHGQSMETPCFNCNCSNRKYASAPL